MKRKELKKKQNASLVNSVEDGLSLHSDIIELKKQVDKLTQDGQKMEERLQDVEIHVHLLTRLLTTLCIEKFGMRMGVLKRLIKRIEKEAIRDSQVLHLEYLYKLPLNPEKKNQYPNSSSKDDPWEDIS